MAAEPPGKRVRGLNFGQREESRLTARLTARLTDLVFRHREVLENKVSQPGLFPIPRVNRRRRDPFTELGGDEFRAGFRLSKDTVLHLLSEVGFIRRIYLFTFLLRRYSWPILVLIRLECCGVPSIVTTVTMMLNLTKSLIRN